MGYYTQDQCNSSSITREKLKDGSWFIRGTNGDGMPFEFPDTLSAANASKATSKTNAHTIMKTILKYVGAKPSLQKTKPEEL